MWSFTFAGQLMPHGMQSMFSFELVIHHPEGKL